MSTLREYTKQRGITEQQMEAARARVREYVQAYELKEARAAAKMTQAQLAKRMGVSQKRISVLESGDIAHIEVGTLRRYLESVGGNLQISATMPDGKRLQFV